MSNTRSLRQRLRAGDRAVGALVRIPAEENLEMLAVAGLDFVVVDCEHGPADVLAVRQHLALAEAYAMPVLVRIGAGEGALALRALDHGAQGIIAPHVDTREQAESLVRSVHYPPLGQRGFATYSRAGRFGSVPAEEHRQRALDSTLVLGMIESPTGVHNAEEILRCPGLDGYLVGTADLAASTGPHDLPLGDAVATVHDKGRQAGAIRADIVSDTAAAFGSLADGAQLVVYNLTHVLMTLFRDLRLGDVAGESSTDSVSRPTRASRRVAHQP